MEITINSDYDFTNLITEVIVQLKTGCTITSVFFTEIQVFEMFEYYVVSLNGIAIY